MVDATAVNVVLGDMNAFTQKKLKTELTTVYRDIMVL